MFTLSLLFRFQALLSHILYLFRHLQLNERITGYAYRSDLLEFAYILMRNHSRFCLYITVLLAKCHRKKRFLFIVSIASSRHFRYYKVQQNDVSGCFFFNDHNFTSSKLITFVSTLAQYQVLYLIFLVQEGSYLCLQLNVRF